MRSVRQLIVSLNVDGDPYIHVKPGIVGDFLLVVCS